MPKTNNKTAKKKTGQSKPTKTKTKRKIKVSQELEQEIVDQLQRLNKEIKSTVNQLEKAYSRLDPQIKKGILVAAAALTAVLAGSKILRKKRKTK